MVVNPTSSQQEEEYIQGRLIQLQASSSDLRFLLRRKSRRHQSLPQAFLPSPLSPACRSCGPPCRLYEVPVCPLSYAAPLPWPVPLYRQYPTSGNLPYIVLASEVLSCHAFKPPPLLCRRWETALILPVGGDIKHFS